MLIQQNGKLFILKAPTSLKLAYVYGKGLALLANKKFKKGDKIIYLNGQIVRGKDATPEAVQIGADRFLDTKQVLPEDFINHHCEANTRCDIGKRWFIAIKDISKNAEITFNYKTTEYDMKKSGTDFRCVCGAKKCYGRVQGFKYLNIQQQKKLLPYLSEFLCSKIKK